MIYTLAIENESLRLTRLKDTYAIFSERYPEEAREFISRDGFPNQYRSLLQAAEKP
jgi:hypothetical protein